MKKALLTTLAVLSLITACVEPELTPDPIVVIPEGAVVLEDTRLGMYYGDHDYDGVGQFSLVLSDARCYEDKVDNPYIDSEGDMLVLQLRTQVLASDSPMDVPAGEYVVSDSYELNTISAFDSYVRRLVGTVQSKWNLKSGTVTISRDDKGSCSVTTKDLVIFKGDQIDTVDYICVSNIEVRDYMLIAPSTVTLYDDIVSMPFPKMECIYNGDLYGNGTGNFVVNLSTKGFVNEAGEMANIPGIHMTLNFFSRLYQGNSEPVLEAGTYNVSTATSDALFQRWSILPGLFLETTPFGSYIFQRPSVDDEITLEFIKTGVVNVDYEINSETKASTQTLILNYSFTTASRKISGMWKGDVMVDNQGGTSNESYLTTLDHDVECDMSKVEGGTIRLLEVLHRENVNPDWDYDIAEAWQLYLQPRDWNAEEKNIPWVDPDKVENWQNYVPEGAEKPTDPEFYIYDKDGNGVRDRLDAWCADGDFMIFEFILPLGSDGQIAPELNKEYKYTFQPSLAMDDESYEIYVSRMGRPYDEIFDQSYAKQNPGWASFLEGYDFCNARRGFTWSDDGWRGNWYMHYEKGEHMVLDGYAPAINGWVKVIRTADQTYTFEWDFIDDLPGTPNRITGRIEDCTVRIQK